MPETSLCTAYRSAAPKQKGGMMENQLSTKQVCELYGVTQKTVCEWIREKKMPYLSFGHRNFFIPSELKAWEEKYKYNRIDISKVA
jgi:excisionase family DNA binding protein